MIKLSVYHNSVYIEDIRNFAEKAMYEKKIPFDISCGIKIAMEVIGGKWKSCIIYDLRNGPMRPSELFRLYPEANVRVMNQQMKELMNYKIVQKKIYAELPPHSEYSLTEIGKSLLPIVLRLEKWGDSFRPTMREILKMED